MCELIFPLSGYYWFPLLWQNGFYLLQQDVTGMEHFSHHWLACARNHYDVTARDCYAAAKPKLPPPRPLCQWLYSVQPVHALRSVFDRCDICDVYSYNEVKRSNSMAAGTVLGAVIRLHPPKFSLPKTKLGWNWALNTHGNSRLGMQEASVFEPKS